MRRRGATLVYLRHFWWRGATGGVIATIGYGIAIWALSLGAMAHVTALRETSALFGALIGAFILKESFGARRIAAAAVMVAGLLLMNLRLSRDRRQPVAVSSGGLVRAAKSVRAPISTA